MRRSRKRYGQSTLEYAILIAVIVAGLIGMQAYVKRGMQGRLESAANDIGEQYSPGLVTSTYTTTSDQTSTETVSGGTTTTDVTSQQQTRTGYEDVQALDQEIWPE